MKCPSPRSLVAVGLASVSLGALAATTQPAALRVDQQEQLAARRLAHGGGDAAPLAQSQLDAARGARGGADGGDRRPDERRRGAKYRVDCLDCSLPGAALRPVKVNSSGVIAANDIATGQGYVIAAGMFTATPLAAGASVSTVSDINDAGHLVGMQAAGGSDIGGYLWSPGTITMIDGLNGAAAHPSALNAADQVAGSSLDSSFIHEGGVTKVLPAPPGHSISWSTGINVAGHVVGSAYSGGVYWDPDAWRYAGGTLTVLSPQFVSTYANAINDLDEVAGSVDSYAAYWSASGRLTILNALPGFSTGMASGINIHGAVVGILAANNSSAYPRIAFVWDGRTLHDLNSLIQGGAASGWLLNEADSINDAGVIVGLGMLNGQSHAFIATPAGH